MDINLTIFSFLECKVHGKIFSSTLVSQQPNISGKTKGEKNLYIPTKISVNYFMLVHHFCLLLLGRKETYW